MDVPPSNSNSTRLSISNSTEDEPHSNASAENSNPAIMNSKIVNSYGASITCSGARHSPKVTQSQIYLPVRNSISPSVSRKIMGKNHNNIVFPTSLPNNLAELQLFRVMQNASLLLYYDTLLEMGGDDVQQLCDAGEEEFLEIMSLVGMASKPLHVRRLQKSLQEWVTNPLKFKMPLIPGDDYEIELSSPKVSGNHVLYCADSGDNITMYSPSPAEICIRPPVISPSLNSNNQRSRSPLDTSYPPSSSSSPSSNASAPTLMENQVIKLTVAAERLSKQLPNLEPKPLNTKRKVCKELELVISMPENDPRRMDEIRRYAAIYGRFDCKRKPEKPLTLHELSVNEAAAQICRFVPALLTRRDELFPLARQVVKDSGCGYSKSQLSTTCLNKQLTVSQERGQTENNVNQLQGRYFLDADIHHNKRIKVEPCSDSDDQRQDHDEVSLMRHAIRTPFHAQTDSHTPRENPQTSIGMELNDSDSQYTYSNSSSPQNILGNCNESENDSTKLSSKVQVIAASGDNIIAVANPALVFSRAIIPITAITVQEKDTDEEKE